MNRLLKIFVTILVLPVLLVACNVSNKNVSEEKKNSADKLNVYTTIYPLQYFSKRIGGDYINVENIIPPGTDAHTFELSSKAMVKIAQSEAFIYSGTGIDGFSTSVIKSIKKEDVQIINAANGINLLKSTVDDSHEDHATETDKTDKHEEELDVDPHVWLDPNRAIKLAENIKDSLVKLKPSAKKDFEDNFISLKQDLEKLDNDFKDMANKSPNKTFIVSHSAYGYWEDVYGLKQIGISGLSPTNEPSQKKLKEIIEIAQKNNISYILFEPNLSNKVAQVVKKEVGANTLTLHNLESLTTNNIKNKDDYFSIMRNNISSLQKALQ
ncbi:metal ABC transporter substrate-binding protein [Bacillus cereus]|uniref:metal ABC transporter substrate-binding protein n=1 Tax=Bacillus cereus TaxID=1396 RepID=UPI00382954D3